MYTRYEFILYTESIPIYKPKQEKPKKKWFFLFFFCKSKFIGKQYQLIRKHKCIEN